MNHLLDEPTTGLDPRSSHTMWQIIRDLVAGGDTIFLTTQYLMEADQLADSIAVLEHGKLVAQGTTTGAARGVGWASADSSRMGSGYGTSSAVVRSGYMLR